jgi:cyclophilin family peptidyl-prolyl cis-trans isomerase
MWFRSLRNILILICAVFCMSTVMANEEKKEKAPAVNLENRIYVQLQGGRVVIDLLPKVAPNHVARIKELAREKFYDGVVFHRVIDGFMAQTGDPTGTGAGGSSKPDLKAEFNDTPHDRGTVSMARAASNDSANSQFFIVLEDSHFLDGKYTVFGKVVEGMQFVDAIKKGDARKNGTVVNPDKIITMRVAADVKEEGANEEGAAH